MNGRRFALGSALALAALDCSSAAFARVRVVETTEAVRLVQASPLTVARAVATGVRGVRVRVSGGSIVIAGPRDAVARAKRLASSLDVPPRGVAYPQVYRLRGGDPGAVADFLKQTFPGVAIAVDAPLGALAVTADASLQRRIGDALAQFDAPPGGAPGVAGGDPNAASLEVYTLRSALPGVNGAASSSATDIASTVTQALAAAAPDLRITVAPTSNQLIIAGSAQTIALAKQLIAQLDIAQKLVVLDTQVLEIDDTVAKDLGLSFTQPVISTTYSEIAPPNNADGTPQQLLGFAPLTRTPLSLGFQLNLLVQNGKGRVLADPRITTVSGRTATIRAGDTISIQTTTGGGTGTIATTQLQTFQTGVTLDITPIVNADDAISVLLHPTVNSETGLLNGIPQISTRDTQTTVTLHDNETLVIGGLIQDTTTRNETKIPILGDLPLLGPIFRDNQVNHTRNELVITVTPHVVVPGERNAFAGGGLPRTPAQDASPPPSAIVLPSAPAVSVSLGLNGPGPQNPAPVATTLPAPAPVSTGTAGGALLKTYSYTAPPGDATMPRFLSVTVSPTTIVPGLVLHATATTNGDVRSVALVIGSTAFNLASVAPGRWETTSQFTAAQRPSGAPAASVMLATLGDGRTFQLNLPLSVAP